MKRRVVGIDDDDDEKDRRFMVNAISEPTLGMHDDIDVPIICLDDDDDDDDDNGAGNLKIDRDYKVFLDDLSNCDGILGPLFEVNNGKSDIRKFDESKPVYRVSQDRKRKTLATKTENSKDIILADILRDNRAAERRKRRIVDLEATRTARTVPSVTTQVDIERENLAAEQKKQRIVELEAPRSSRAVPILKTQQRDNKIVRECLRTETLSGGLSLVRIQEGIQGDKRAAGRIKRKISEPIAAETCTVTHVERVKKVTVVVDKDYKCYLEWLLDSLKDSITKPKANVPDPNATKESTVILHEDKLVEVKVERDVEPWSDDSDIIAMSDSPFMDGEDTLFVTSKKVVDLDGGSKEVESSSRCRFKKELMNVLKKPYNEGELVQLHHEASIHRKLTRSRELRKGRETYYETNELGKSYLEKFTDFENEYKAVNGVDKVRALKLLRGFFFYLKHVSHDGVFKPWVKDQWWQP